MSKVSAQGSRGDQRTSRRSVVQIVYQSSVRWLQYTYVHVHLVELIIPPQDDPAALWPPLVRHLDRILRERGMGVVRVARPCQKKLADGLTAVNFFPSCTISTSSSREADSTLPGTTFHMLGVRSSGPAGLEVQKLVLASQSVRTVVLTLAASAQKLKFARRAKSKEQIFCCFKELKIPADRLRPNQTVSRSKLREAKKCYVR